MKPINKLIYLNTQALRAIRQERGMTLAQLSDAAGFGPYGLHTISSLEKGRRPDPQLSTVTRLAKALGVEVGALCLKEPERK
jgi:transcriptional regulator with XRE-family HTH domain